MFFSRAVSLVLVTQISLITACMPIKCLVVTFNFITNRTITYSNKYIPSPPININNNSRKVDLYLDSDLSLAMATSTWTPGSMAMAVLIGIKEGKKREEDLNYTKTTTFFITKKKKKCCLNIYKNPQKINRKLKPKGEEIRFAWRSQRGSTSRWDACGCASRNDPRSCYLQDA